MMLKFHNKSFAVATMLIIFAINTSVRVHSTEQSEEIYANSTDVGKSRMKRYLSFQPGTRIFVR